MVLCIFFFQAKDGIRDRVRSGGLGDVYKRQVLPGRPGPDRMTFRAKGFDDLQGKQAQGPIRPAVILPVALTIAD